jgi:hypothetical protein
MKRSFSFLTIVLTVFTLIFSACGPATASVTPTVQPRPTIVPTEVMPSATPSPAVTAAPTLTAQRAAIEKAWAIQKPRIDAAVASVFNKDVTSPWLWPVLDITTLLPDSPVAHCQAMKLWDNFIRVPDSLAGCSANHGSFADYFGITTMPLETKGEDKFVLKMFFFQPLPYCDEVKCILLPAPGSALYGMSVGDYYEVVSVCKKPTGTPTKNSLYQLLPYLNDPVSMIIKWSGNYIEIVANRGAWFSFGWESGEGWDEVFQICPSP